MTSKHTNSSLININLCFVKQPWVVAWTWQSTRFTTPQAMLDAFYYKPNNLSLLLACQGDVWVMEDSLCLSNTRRMWEEADPDATTEIYKQTPITEWGSVPWGDYDLVFSGDPIMPPEIIKAYPEVLWCHGIGEHTSGTYKKALGSYDLFWDSTLTAPNVIGRLPQAVALPYMVNAEIMRGLVRPTNDPAVFLPARSAQAEKPPETLAGLPVKHPGTWDRHRTLRAILDGLVKPLAQYYQDMGSCRYLLNVRPGGEIGQPIIEAAALGLIVVSARELYSTVVHPFCRIHSVDEGVRMIRQLEASPGIRRKVLEYQDRALWRQFWDEPLANLRKALDIKKEGQ